MNLKELAQQYHLEAAHASNDIMNILRQQDCGYNMDVTDSVLGVHIHFMFRGECDYSLLFPWEYANDPSKIKDYYSRFKAAIQNTHCISEIEPIAYSFAEQELKLLGN